MKLSLADVIGAQTNVPRVIEQTGRALLDHCSNDNTSPETFSFYVVPLRSSSDQPRSPAPNPGGDSRSSRITQEKQYMKSRLSSQWRNKIMLQCNQEPEGSVVKTTPMEESGWNLPDGSPKGAEFMTDALQSLGMEVRREVVEQWAEELLNILGHVKVVVPPLKKLTKGHSVNSRITVPCRSQENRLPYGLISQGATVRTVPIRISAQTLDMK
jgi:hypothetical protein